MADRTPVVHSSTSRVRPERSVPADPDASGRSAESEVADAVDDGRWLLLLWPLAVLFHLAGNSHHLLRMDRVGALQLLLVVAAIGTIIRPRPAAAAGLAVIHLVVFGAKLPFVGNHEMILAFIDVVVLTSVIATAAVARRARVRGVGLGGRRPWASMAGPGLRLVLLGSYSAIALSKLNHAFFDPVASCAVVFGSELGRWVGLDPAGRGPLAAIVIVSSALIEASIPPLLIMRRTRAVGVVVGLTFHSILALDPVGHVFDFSSALLPLFLLFLPLEVRRGLGDRFDQLRSGRPGNGPGTEIGLVLTIAVVLHGLVLFTGSPRWAIAYPLWVVVDGAVLMLVLNGLRHRSASAVAADRNALRPGRWAIPVLAVIAVVAVAPYLDLRTAASLNMYSNLRVIDGSSNHLLLPAFDGVGRDRVRIVHVHPADGIDEPDSAAIDALAPYVEDRSLVPEENLRRHLTRHPGLEVEVVRPGGDPSQAVVFPPDRGWSRWDELLHRIAYRRAASAGEPASCARSWGPLG